MEIDDKLACQIHGIGAISSDSDSDYDGKAEFDEEYYQLKPPPIDYNSHKDKIIVKNVSTSVDYEQESTNSSVSNSKGKEIGSIIPKKHKKRKRSKNTLENVTQCTTYSAPHNQPAKEQRTFNSPNVNYYDAEMLKKAEENLDKILQSRSIQKNGHTSKNKGVEGNTDIETYETWMKIVLAEENALDDKENCKSNSNALKSNTEQDLSKSKAPSADPSTNGTTKKKKKKKIRCLSSLDLEDATVAANLKNASIANIPPKNIGDLSNNMNKGVTNTVEIKDTLSVMSLKKKESTETKISQENGGKFGSKLLHEQTMGYISKSNTNAVKSNTEQDPSESKTQFANPLTSGATKKKINAFSSVDLAEDVVANIENASKAYILPINTVDLRNNIDKVDTNSVEIKDTLYVRSLKNISQKSTQENIEILRSKLLHEETMGHIWQLPQNVDTRLLSQSVTGIKSSLVATGPKTKANKKQKQSVTTKSKTKEDKTQTQSFATVVKTKQKQPETNGAVPKANPNTQVASQTKVQKPIQMPNVQKQSVAAASKTKQKQPGTNGAVPKANPNKQVASQKKVQKLVQMQNVQKPAPASKAKQKQSGTNHVTPKANPNIQVTPQSKVQIPVQMQNVQNNGIVNSNYSTYVGYNNTNLPLQIPLNFNRGQFQNTVPNLVLRVPHAPPNAHCSAEQLFIENVQRQMVYNNRYGPNLTPYYCNQRPVPQFANPNNQPIPQNWNFANYENPQNHFNAPLPNYISNNNAPNCGFVDRNISCTVTELSYRNVNSTDRGVVNEASIASGFNLSQNGTLRNDQLQLENMENVVNISNETRLQSLGGSGESDRLLSALEISNRSLKSNESEKNIVASFSRTESEVYPTNSDRYIAARSVECKIQAYSHLRGTNDDLDQHYGQLIVKSKPKLDYFCDNKSSINYRSPFKRKAPRYDPKKIFYFKTTIFFLYVIILSVLLMNLANAVTIFLQDNILSIFGIVLCFICVKVINFLEAL